MLVYGREDVKLDVLVLGPHPDDAEIGTGGVLLKLAARGKCCGVVDLTQGEMGSGDPKTRQRESAAAAEVLKLAVRENMGLPDCALADTFENRCAVAAVIRKYQPDVVLGTFYDLPPGRGLGHADHIYGGLLVAHGANFAHLKKLPVDGAPWHSQAVYYYFLPPDLLPSFVVDVTEHYEGWIASIMCHESQFGRPEQNPQMRTFFESNATRWARWAGGRYAQAFFSPWPLSVSDVLCAAQLCTPEEQSRV